MRKYIFTFIAIALCCHIASAQSNADLAQHINALDKKLTECETALQQANEKIKQQDEIILTLKTELSETKKYIAELSSKLNGSFLKSEETNNNSNVSEQNTATRDQSNKKTVQPSATVNRCQAITQKGTQCKRTAQAGSKYCWQHQK